jgi:hypothetical protein
MEHKLLTGSYTVYEEETEKKGIEVIGKEES